MREEDWVEEERQLALELASSAIASGELAVVTADPPLRALGARDGFGLRVADHDVFVGV